MINKIYKRIHIKYSNIFNFFFFLRYVFVIFLIAASLFISIPKYFNYEKKKIFIQEYLINYYDMEINNFSKIEYKIFPLPNLSIKNVNFKIKDKQIDFKSKNIFIFLNLKNIYDYKNFKAKRIVLSKNEVFLDINKIKNLINYFSTLKNKIDINDLNLNLKKKDNVIVKLKNINFSNYGYKKYQISGDIFNKKFKASLKNDNENLNFKIIDTGIKAKFKFHENMNKLSTGLAEISLLNHFLKFNFHINNNRLEIFRSNFRNNNLSFSLDSLIKLNPFFKIRSNIIINEINNNLITNTNLENLLSNPHLIKKINGKININYKSKKYFTDLIENAFFDIDLVYGKLIFSNIVVIAGNNIKCQSDSVLTKEYPRLNFICNLDLKNRKKLYKKLSISKKLNKENLKLDIEGSLNLLNKKINFTKINSQNNYIANTEDKKYFKEMFEKILFDEEFFKMFDKNKIKSFLLEII